MEAHRQTGSGEPGARVLIVEDHPMIAELVETRLRIEGMRPTKCLGGREAIQVLGHADFDLTKPEQMRERAAVVGQFPTRPGLYDDPDLASGLAVSPATVRKIIEYSVPRPVTPVYTQLSEILQIQLHRALTRQATPAAALAAAQAQMQRLLNRVGLGTEGPVAQR